MVLYLANVPIFRERLDNGISSMHCVLLQMLDLAVMLFLDEEDKAHEDYGHEGQHNEKNSSGQALRQIVSVLAAMNSLGQKVLNSLGSEEWEARMVRWFHVESSRSFLTSVLIFRTILD
jgi:hypothetical protein